LSNRNGNVVHKQGSNNIGRAHSFPSVVGVSEEFTRAISDLKDTVASLVEEIGGLKERLNELENTQQANPLSLDQLKPSYKTFQEALARISGEIGIGLARRYAPLNTMMTMLKLKESEWTEAGWIAIKSGVEEIVNQRQCNRAAKELRVAHVASLQIRGAFLSFLRETWSSLPAISYFYGQEALYECIDGPNYYYIRNAVAKKVCEVLFCNKTVISCGREVLELPGDECKH
jgi:hypothetical protein